VTSPEAAAVVDAERALGNKLNVVATPTFFVGRANGPDAVTVQRVLVGAVDLDALSQAIDFLLQKR
jgi:protein-disulfide isomerase